MPPFRSQLLEIKNNRRYPFPKMLSLLWLARKRHRERHPSHLCHQCIAHSFVAMICQRIPHLMAQDHGETRFIVATAGDDAVVFLGASLRHDVYRRLLGSLPIQILARTKYSVLVVNALPEGDRDFFADPDSC